MSFIGRENRQHQRRPLYFYLEVLDRETGKEIGRLVDIHVAGLLLVSETRHPSGQEFQLRVLVNDPQITSLHGELDVTAIVRWSKPDVNPAYFITGMQFGEISDQQEKIIDTLITRIGFKK
jgi:hypothetical protein